MLTINFQCVEMEIYAYDVQRVFKILKLGGQLFFVIWHMLLQKHICLSILIANTCLVFLLYRHHIVSIH